VHRAKQQKLLGSTPTAAIDATGLDSQYKSHYFCMRAGRQSEWSHFVKLTAVCDTRSQLILSAQVDRGPSNDSPQFPGCICRAASRTKIRRVLADAAYDCEDHHRLCREQLNIPESIIPTRKRNSNRWPRTPYRREMKRAFPKELYGQRWQSESTFSRFKRRLSSSLSSCRWDTQVQQGLLRVLTNDLMIVLFCTLKSLSLN